MTIEKTKATDVVSSGLTCGTKTGETAQATGVYHVECRDKDGNLKWTADSKNLVVNAGLAVHGWQCFDFSNPDHHLVSWACTVQQLLIHLRLATLWSSHAGWTEVVPITAMPTRVTATLATATTANPSVVTNSASPAVFNINGN